MRKDASKSRYYYIDDVYIGNVPQNLKYIFSNIVFKIDESEIVQDFIPQLDLIYDYLIANRTTKIIISGHTDNAGSELHNKELSIERAKSVTNFLINKGVDVARVSYKGYGSEKPQ